MLPRRRSYRTNGSKAPQGIARAIAAHSYALGGDEFDAHRHDSPQQLQPTEQAKAAKER